MAHNSILERAAGWVIASVDGQGEGGESSKCLADQSAMSANAVWQRLAYAFGADWQWAATTDDSIEVPVVWLEQIEAGVCRLRMRLDAAEAEIARRVAANNAVEDELRYTEARLATLLDAPDAASETREYEEGIGVHTLNTPSIVPDGTAASMADAETLLVDQPIAHTRSIDVAHDVDSMDAYQPFVPYEPFETPQPDASDAACSHAASTFEKATLDSDEDDIAGIVVDDLASTAAASSDVSHPSAHSRAQDQATAAYGAGEEAAMALFNGLNRWVWRRKHEMAPSSGSTCSL